MALIEFVKVRHGGSRRVTGPEYERQHRES